ncbi:hypothetical protein EG347_04405 [Chryseobacterium sp. G0186]|uniref:hypothetical protein n=1 Tax=Chryseobacterium sp. G0186 TaxID=2487064 RepID=UPI000F4E4004|nr:hypothetical protein [Chryseobacterium sp. G0186]AZA76809.1 hypothetical protein EG347_04405 [Chryseobacterium sp. G0186]
MGWELNYIDWELLYFILILALFAGVAYLVMRFFKRWTMKTNYAVFLNVLVFLVSFLAIFFTAVVIFLTNVSFER